MSYVPHVIRKISCVTCPMSHVACRVSPVTCQLSLTPTATATDPPPGSSPIMHMWLVPNDPKTQKNYKTQKIIETTKMSRGMPI